MPKQPPSRLLWTGANVTADLSFDRDLASLAGRLDDLTAVVGRAAAAILAVDPATAGRRQKSDRSFVTHADEAAQAVVLQGLSEIFPGLPAICEEATGLPRPDTLGRCFALVDPLDGTREFLDGRPEFTVNLAVVRAGVAVLGIIAAPVLGRIWRGFLGSGAERLRFDPARPGIFDEIVPVHTRPQIPGRIRVAVSRSHLDADTAALLSRLAVSETIVCGSSLKFCRVAEGGADLYPRLAPTFEWDIAAGDALLAAAGGVVKKPDGTPLRYGQIAEGFRVPAFLAFGNPAAAREIIEGGTGRHGR
jgi:3'(2'), 5'-bisphosphate nucleotidase